MPNRHRILTSLLILCVSLLASLSATFAQSSSDWTAPYRAALLPQFAGDMFAFEHAPRYAIELTIAPGTDTATVTGTQTVTYTNTLADISLDTIVFRLYPNLPSYGAEMAVSHVQVDGLAVDPALDDTGTVLTVPLAASLMPGASVSISMDFTITLTADRARLYAQFSHIDGVLSLPNAYPLLSIYEPGAGWWQITDHPQGDAVYSQTSFYTVRVTAPAELILAASGSEVDLRVNDDGSLTHTYVAPLVRDFAFFSSADFVTLSGEQDGIIINVTYNPAVPDAESSARAGVSIAQESVRVFNQAFGHYPYAELDMVQTPNLAAGIEYPGVFVIANSVWDKEDSFFEFVIAHEAAHEWWYGLVGNDQTQQPWIDEALAQYAVAVYIRDREGPEAYTAALDSYRFQHANFIKQHTDQLIGEPVAAYDDNAYFYMIYQKGPLFYAALDDMFGYDAVIAALHDLFAAHRYQTVETQDLLASFEASFGAELDSVFAEWVGTFAVG